MRAIRAAQPIILYLNQIIVPVLHVVGLLHLFTITGGTVRLMLCGGNYFNFIAFSSSTFYGLSYLTVPIININSESVGRTPGSARERNTRNTHTHPCLELSKTVRSLERLL
jgi:hypothetical protein